MGLGGVSFWQLIILLAIPVLFIVLPFWTIFRKAGFNPLLSLLMLVPIVNLAMLYFLAFSPWPAVENPETRRPA